MPRTPMVTLPDELKDRYRVLDELGQGGFGLVLAAEDLQLGRRVAVKLLYDADDADFAARFQREAQVTASLRHPHVVAVYDYGVAAGGSAYILYELVEGPSLASEVAARPPSSATVVRWGTQLAEALQAAHEAGVVHRDVKPGNVLLRQDGQAVLCDFGIAHRPQGRTVVTEAGVRLGTPAYMAPEALLEGATTPAADQFALASTLLEALTGQPAYGTWDLDGVLQVLRGARPIGALALARVPRGLRTVLARALERDPAKRFPDLGSLAQALGAADLQGSAEEGPRHRKGPGPTGATTTRKRMGPRPEPRSRRLVRRIGVGWVVLLGAVAVAYGLLSPPSRPPVPSPRPTPTQQFEAARAQREERLEAAGALLDRHMAAWTAPHRPAAGGTGDPGGWLAVNDPEHRRSVRAQSFSPDFTRRLNSLERAFLSWEGEAWAAEARAAEAAEEAARGDYLGRVQAVAFEFLPHLHEDMQSLHEESWRDAMGGNFILSDGQHRVPEHLQKLEASTARIVERLARDPETCPLWRLRVALWLAASNAVESPMIEKLVELYRDRVGGAGVSAHQFREAVPVMVRAVRVLRSREVWTCPQARAWNSWQIDRLLESPWEDEPGVALDAVHSVVELESSILQDCHRRGADQAILDLRPLLVRTEALIDHVPGSSGPPSNLGVRLHVLWNRNQEGAAESGYVRSGRVARLLMHVFWLSEKLIYLARRPQVEAVPKPLEDRVAWIRARLPAADADGNTREAGVYAAYRGMKVLGRIPWPLLEAMSEIASATPFPARTYLAGRLRLRMMETESAEERRPMEVALDRMTRHYSPRATWGCAMLRGEMWGNIHAEQSLRRQMAPELTFFAATDTLTPFLAGAGTNAGLLLRDCRGRIAEEDERRALALLEDAARGRDRGVRTAAESICYAGEFPGPGWEALGTEGHAAYAWMQQLCR